MTCKAQLSSTESSYQFRSIDKLIVPIQVPFSCFVIANIGKRPSVAIFELVKPLKKECLLIAYAPQHLFYNVNACCSYLEDNIQKNNSMYWAIPLETTNEFARTICLFDFSHEKRTCEIVYELMTRFQGQGIMKETAKKVIEYAFRTLQFKQIVAFTHNGNKHSIKLLMKHKFTKSKGTYKENPIIAFIH